jgi:ribosomal protein S18 acetylase RimI-like enzyme
VTDRVFRRAEHRDLETVSRISAEAYIDAYRPVIGAVPKPAEEDYSPRIERGEVWLLDVGNEAAGIAVFEITIDHLLVYSIAVPPRLQGRGHGRAMLSFAERHAATLGLMEIRLYTNRRMTRNLDLYRQCGFLETGTRPHPSRTGEVLVDLAKRLGGLTDA